jgi:hypothetical protein
MNGAQFHLRQVGEIDGGLKRLMLLPEMRRRSLRKKNGRLIAGHFFLGNTVSVERDQAAPRFSSFKTRV